MSALYGFAYSESALKYLESAVPAKFRGQIKRKIELLASDPYPAGSKKLHAIKEGNEDVHSLRSGDYRILYAVRNSPKQIVVLDIDHRKDVYR